MARKVKPSANIYLLNDLNDEFNRHTNEWDMAGGGLPTLSRGEGWPPYSDLTISLIMYSILNNE